MEKHLRRWAGVLLLTASGWLQMPAAAQGLCWPGLSQVVRLPLCDNGAVSALIEGDGSPTLAGPTSLAPSGRSAAVPYRLVEGSMLTDECAICGRPTLLIPIRGSFTLEPVEPNPLFSNFLLRDLKFESLIAYGLYTGRMEGTYRIGGEVAIVHQMSLLGTINATELRFDSGLVAPQTPLPWIEIDLAQLPPLNPLQTFSLHLVAVPWPQLCFSTEVGFTPSNLKMQHVSDGDLVSSKGVVVCTNNQLSARLGIMPIVPDIGLDAAMQVIPCLHGGKGRCTPEVWFSCEQNIFSETIGPLHQGDLLSSAGRIVRSYADLIGPFSPMPPVPDFGLDAVAFAPEGMLLFSAEQGFFSEGLGISISDGDLLAEDGRIFRTSAQLLAKFQPVEPRPISFGLDAAFVWPSGEVWFSVKADFVDSRWGRIGHGDLLSDTGRVVARNLEMLGPFSPLEDLADFGLDALHVCWPGPAGDLDHDSDVDAADLALFAASWRQTNRDPASREPSCAACCSTDLNCDGKVDFSDLMQFAQNWLAAGICISWPLP